MTMTNTISILTIVIPAITAILVAYMQYSKKSTDKKIETIGEKQTASDQKQDAIEAARIELEKAQNRLSLASNRLLVATSEAVAKGSSNGERDAAAQEYERRQQEFEAAEDDYITTMRALLPGKVITDRVGKGPGKGTEE